MRLKKLLLPFAILLVCGCTVQKKNVEDNWIQLFNGKDLADWTIKIKDHEIGENFGNTFRVEDGVLKVNYDQYNGFKEQYGHIFYNKPFGAYLLEVEYRFTGNQVAEGPGWAFRNSGMMLHCQAPQTMAKTQDFPISLEAQLLGGTGSGERSTGNLCTPGTHVVMNGKLFTPHCINSTSKTYRGDGWVHAEVLVLRDSVIKHIIEGDTVLTYFKPQYDGNDKWVKHAGLKGGETIKEGYISLQSESHPLEFRKVALFNLDNYINNSQKLEAVLNQLRSRQR